MLKEGHFNLQSVKCIFIHLHNTKDEIVFNIDFLINFKRVDRKWLFREKKREIEQWMVPLFNLVIKCIEKVETDVVQKGVFC